MKLSILYKRMFMMIHIGFMIIFFATITSFGESHDTGEAIHFTSGIPHHENTIRIFLCGDAMTGRGIDQILSHPGDPVLHESYMKNAKGYVALAEQENGAIPDPVNESYIWGDALYYWRDLAPDIRIVNLETSITDYDTYWHGKAVNYRMNPENIGCLTKAGIDYCALANNHLLDYGREGLYQSLQVLQDAGISFSGGGKDLDEAREPAVMTVSGKGRVLVFSIGRPSSGIPIAWAATDDEGGIYLPQTEDEILNYLKACLKLIRQDRDVVVVSIHWGSNWGYDIPARQRYLAHRLIDEAGADVIHGHSSHHFKGIEEYRNRLIIYGAGDFINDYEGIHGHEEYRGDLTLMYFVDMNNMTGVMEKMIVIPLKIRKMRLEKAGKEDRIWVLSILNREGGLLNTQFVLDDQNRIILINN